MPAGARTSACGCIPVRAASPTSAGRPAGQVSGTRNHAASAAVERDFAVGEPCRDTPAGEPMRERVRSVAAGLCGGGRVCCRSHSERLEEPGRDKLGERLARVACNNKRGNVVVLGPHISQGTKRAERAGNTKLQYDQSSRSSRAARRCGIFLSRVSAVSSRE
jgi:hypothetical protein